MGNVETFSAKVDSWISKSEVLMTEVARESIQRLLEKVQTPKAQGGRMPVQTGFLRSSMVVTLNTPHVGFSQRVKGKMYDYPFDQYLMTINNFKLGDKVFAVFASAYAIHQEYGTSRMPGNFFVRTAAQEWPQTVNGVVRELADT